MKTIFNKSKKYISYLLLTIIILGLFNPIGEAIQETEIDNLNKISVEVMNSFDDEKYIDVIIYLNQQLDFDKSAGNSKHEVVKSLKDLSENNQQRLIDYIEEEKIKGNVLEYNSYFIVNALRLKATEEVIKNISNMNEVKAIYPNTKIEVEEPEKSKVGLFGRDEGDIPWNIKNIGADKVWGEFGIDGSGVVIGILDSGVFWQHEALKEKWRGYDPNDPENPVPQGNWFDATSNKALPYDDSKTPHGTHVTGTILGQDNLGVNKIGVAPGAKWIAAKALTSSGGYYSWIISAGEWMLAPNGDPDLAPDIINNSWGNTDKDEFGKNEWFRGMVQAWRAAGILPVFASGNTKSGEAEAGSICIPANYPESFAVGAVDSANKLATFSQRGPSPYDGAIKPEITAPGVNIRSSIENGYESGWNGTSMAAPHIAGVAALILSANKDLTIDELENIIKSTATQLTDANYPLSPNQGYGHGIVNAYEAVAEVMGNRKVVKIQGSVMTQTENTDTEDLIPINAKISIRYSEKKYEKLNVLDSTVTNLVDGTYLLSPSINIEGEKLILRVEAYGYVTKEIEIGENSSFPYTENVVLNKVFAGSIKGQIVYGNNLLSDAEIRIKGNTRIDAVFSDENGNFELMNIPDGKHTLLISKINYQKKEIEVEINAEQLDLNQIEMIKYKYGSIEIGYDDGTAENGVVESTNAEGAKGTAMRITPSRLGKLVGANIYFTDDSYPLPEGNRIGIAINGIDFQHDEFLVEPIFFEIERGKWNYLDLSRLEFSTDEDFYIVTVQEGEWQDIPPIGLDENTVDDERSFFYNKNGFYPLTEDTHGLYNGTLMIRALMEYEIGVGQLTNIPKLSYTNKASINIEGAIDKDNDISIYNNGNLVKNIASKNNIFASKIDLFEGENIILVESVIGDNAIEIDSIIIIKDTISPIIELISPQNDQISTQASIQLIGNVNEEYLDELLINDKVVNVLEEGKFSLYVELQKGENEIKIEAFDKAGNTSTNIVRVIYKEDNTPELPPPPSPPPTPPAPTPPLVPPVAVVPPLEPIKPEVPNVEDIEKPIKDKKKFSDLENFKWAEEAIEFLSNKGIIQGKTESNFDPKSNLTRAEFITLIVRTLELDEELDTINPFKDVNVKDWYYKSILLAYKKGLINGKSEMEFDPHGNITRQEIIKILGSLLIQKDYKVDNFDTLGKFTDEDLIADWARQETVLVVQNGLILGQNDQLMPKKDTSRAEAAMVVYRLYKLLDK